MKILHQSKESQRQGELIISQEDYEAGLKRGLTGDDLLQPGRYKFKRGGFLQRHPELEVCEEKRCLNTD